MTAAIKHGFEDGSFAHVERPDALRRMHLVAGDGEQVATDAGNIDGQLPCCLHSVGMEINIRFGGDFYRQGLNQTQAEWIGGGIYGSQGGFDFGRDTTALCLDPPACSTGTSTNRANSFASFLLGLPDAASKTFQVPQVYTIRANAYSAYIRDRWNVTPTLTLNYGVRWEYFGYPTRTDRGSERYDPDTNKVLICGMGSVPDGCATEISKKRFSPRLGVAWRPMSTFVIRAGYGMTVDPYEATELQRNNFPVMVPFKIPTDNSFVWPTTLAKGLPPIATPSLGNGVIDIPTDVAFEGQPKKLNRGYIQSWNLTVQKEIGWGFTARLPAPSASWDSWILTRRRFPTPVTTPGRFTRSLAARRKPCSWNRSAQATMIPFRPPCSAGLPGA